MGHNSVVSGHQKSIGIPRVDVLSTGPPDLGCHKSCCTTHQIVTKAARCCKCYSGKSLGDM